MNLAREPRFRLGGIDVRPATREVIHAGGRDVLEPRVMSVLIALAQARGEVVTRDDLTQACWEGRAVSDDAINRVISRIRRVSDLTGGADFTLETITKVGYRLVVTGGEPAQEPVVAAAAAEGVTAEPTVRSPRWVMAVAGVLLIVITGLALGSILQKPEWKPDPTASLTIAVLPFDNLGADQGDEVLALGMARELRNTLSRVRGLRVVSDSSSFAIASEPLTATEMGRRLGADLLLDGSFERTGDAVKLSLELVDGWDGVNVWTGAQSGPASDLDRLRREIAASVFEQMVVRLGPNRLERLAEPRAIDPRAYRALLEANELLEKMSALRLRGRGGEGRPLGERANTLIEGVLASQPDSPMALFLKSRIISMAATEEQRALDLTIVEKQARAADYLRQALAVDPDFAPALGALGEHYRRYEWRWAAARGMFERAVALDPNQADVRLSYSYYLSGAGRCLEALEHARAAVEIDPEFGWRTMGVPRALKCAGRVDDAMKAYLDALAIDPANDVILRDIHLDYMMRGDSEGLAKTRDYIRDVLWKGQPSPEVARWFEWTDANVVGAGGNSAERARALESVARRSFGTGEDDTRSLEEMIGPHPEMKWIGAVLLGFTGQPDRAITMLKGAVDGGTLYIPETMPYGPYEFTPEMRADPRYQAIWKSDPRLSELMALRLEALKAGQMAGTLPGGERVIPQLPVDERS